MSKLTRVMAAVIVCMAPVLAHADKLADIKSKGVLRVAVTVDAAPWGYTDAQGSDSGNQALSQARAETVLMSLQGRQVDVSAMVAKGYGEANPIADNASEVGREANRRIEFTLVVTPPPATPDQVAASAAAGAAAPDFSADTSPSVAPAKKTIRPKPRPSAD